MAIDLKICLVTTKKTSFLAPKTTFKHTLMVHRIYKYAMSFFLSILPAVTLD